MAKICIMCEAPAGSGEHVFPAALGGRRTNRGIYCNAHNNALGRHVANLLGCLDVINAAVGVVPDRHKEVRPAPVRTEHGEEFLFSCETVTVAPPPALTDASELIGEGGTKNFGSLSQARIWAKNQERAGIRVNIVGTGKVETKLIAESLVARRELGTEEFMRGVLYLALTFLAHEYPKVARSDGLAAVRQIVDRDEPVDDRVWWEVPASLEQLSKNPFRCGHTVAIGPIAGTNQVGALISFYGELNFGVALGEIGGESCSDTIITHIDPLAEGIPADSEKTRQEGGAMRLSSIETSKEYLRQIRSGEAPTPLKSVLAMASEQDAAKMCAVLLPQLMALKDMTTRPKMERIVELLGGHDQRIFSLMRQCVDLLVEGGYGVPAPYLEQFRHFVAADDKAPRGLQPQSEIALDLAKVSLAKAIAGHLEADTLDAQVLADLLNGGAGGAVIMENLTQIVWMTCPQ